MVKSVTVVSLRPPSQTTQSQELNPSYTGQISFVGMEKRDMTGIGI